MGAIKTILESTNLAVKVKILAGGGRGIGEGNSCKLKPNFALVISSWGFFFPAKSGPPLRGFGELGPPFFKTFSLGPAAGVFLASRYLG